MYKKNALLSAIKKSDVAKVTAILQKKPQWVNSFTITDPFLMSHDHDTLAVALAHADAATVQAIVAAGSDIKRQIVYKYTEYRDALEMASYFNRDDIIKAWLTEYTAVWPAQGRACQCVLNIAIEHKNIDLVRWMLDHNMAVVQADKEGQCSAFTAAQLGRNPEMIALIEGAMQQAPAKSTPVASGTAMEWHHIDAQSIARTRVNDALGYKMTEVFNFSAGTCLYLQRNLETGVESAAVIEIAKLQGSVDVVEASERLRLQGGVLPSPAKLITRKDV